VELLNRESPETYRIRSALEVARHRIEGFDYMFRVGGRMITSFYRAFGKQVGCVRACKCMGKFYTWMVKQKLMTALLAN
jgi:hypothetical protein